MNARFLDGTVKDGNVVITVVDEDKCELVELSYDFRQGAGTFFGVLAHALAKAGELVFSAAYRFTYLDRFAKLRKLISEQDYTTFAEDLAQRTVCALPPACADTGAAARQGRRERRGGCPRCGAQRLRGDRAAP